MLRLAPRRVDAAAAGAALAQRPNVVIFLTDTLRADHLGAYGHPKPTSPRFDAFAREGIVFEDAWAQSPWTKPSVASIFTGLTPGSHGVVEFNRALARDATTLAQALLARRLPHRGVLREPDRKRPLPLQHWLQDLEQRR